MNALLEALAYSMVRGAVRAYLDVIRERATATEETPNEQDKIRAVNFRDAVTKWMSIHSEKPNATGPEHTAPAGGTGNA